MLLATRLLGTWRTSACVAFVAFCLLPALALAQGEGIAGQVTDTSGGVLPGVTVEAASPALIGGGRVVFTDGQGRYGIIGLSSGAYSVTFSLPGFTTVVVEGINVVGGFTANVTAELQVGNIEESITVTGESPIVDVQNVLEQTVMTREIIDSVPTGTRGYHTLAMLVPGVTLRSSSGALQDVGGTVSNVASLSIHGSRSGEMQTLMDGMSMANGAGRGGAWVSVDMNNGAMEEVAVEFGAFGAESEMGAIRINLVPKDGGNTFNGFFFGTYGNRSMQRDNLSQDLIDRGLISTNSLDEVWDYNPAVGGPIIRDRLWFNVAGRAWGVNQRVAGQFACQEGGRGLVCTPDLNSPAQDNQIEGNETARITFQASPRNKIAIFHSQQQITSEHWYLVPAWAPSAIWKRLDAPNFLNQASWTSAFTSRVLLEAGITQVSKDWHTFLNGGTGPTDYGVLDLVTGKAWGNWISTYGKNGGWQYNTKFSVSYVTGTHALKVGTTFMDAGTNVQRTAAANARSLFVLNGAPYLVNDRATPLHYKDRAKAILGIFAQDQWNADKLTLNLGVRYDWYNAGVPEQTLGPGPRVPNRNVTFPAVNNIPNWHNVTPRLGFSYDVFGDGRTAIKANVGKYLELADLVGITRQNNPVNAISASSTALWTDSNGDGLPQDSEVGNYFNANFGTTVRQDTFVPEVLTNRGYNWEVSGGIEHELVEGISIKAAYFRKWFGNMQITQNRAVTNADFDPYCITVPTDSRLPNGGGNELCGFYDVKPAKFGLTDYFIDLASNYGTQEDVYDGVDITTNMRLGGGSLVAGGVTIGRQRFDTCFMESNLSLIYGGSDVLLGRRATGDGARGRPATTASRNSAFCNVRPPFQANVKLLAVYPLPWGDVQASATYTSLPGREILATSLIRSNVIEPTLGRPLSSGATTGLTTDLVPKGTMFGDRLHQVDFRLTKIFTVKQVRMRGMADFYNLFNRNPVLLYNHNFGANWQQPEVILGGLTFKGAIQLNF